MKKVLVAAILGMAAVASVKAQGVIILYNYNQPSTAITYGASTATSGGLVNGTLGNWTVAIYGGAGSTAAAVNAAMAGDGGFGSLVGIGNLVQATGTASLISGYPGLYGGGSAAATFGFSGAGTYVLVAYNGATYESSEIRGHSLAFEGLANVNPATPLISGTLASAFQVHQAAVVPEPSTFALAGLGLASLLIFRRRK